VSGPPEETQEAAAGFVLGRRLHAAVDGNLASFPLAKQAEVVLGRGEDVDFDLDHVSVSRRHAGIRLGVVLRVEDLGSSNGTWLGGRRLEPGESAALSPGEVIKLGDVSVWVEQQLSLGAPATPEVRQVGELEVVVADPAMHELHDVIGRVAPGEINVLLLGETGAGKEIVARTVHARSARAAGCFVAVNCAALSETLLESELFGHEKGAFTGADRARPGLLEGAAGGTVFLDEVGEMSLSCQAKLLRALEERSVVRLGSLVARSIDVRFVAATNRDLEAEVEVGRFRRDLFYRLDGVTLRVPPLRQRPGEVEQLTQQFLVRYARQLGRATPTLDEASRQALRDHLWPGNVRELRNVIERAVLLSDGGVIRPEHLRLTRAAATPTIERPAVAAPLQREVQAMEKARILSVLEACGGNQSAAARELGMARNTLLRRLDRYGIPRPRKKHE
jgi:two-component system response regulator AtoC